MLKNKNKEPRQVIWRYEYDMYMPFCPACNEPAYEEDHCVFCGQKFLPTKKPKDEHEITVEYGNYGMQQVGKSWYIYQKEPNKLLIHASLSDFMTKKEMEDYLKLYVEALENEKS